MDCVQNRSGASTLARFAYIIIIGGGFLGQNAYSAPILNSNPLAYNKLYLDCSSWTAGDPEIAQVWRFVANAYSTFNVDVTTGDPGDRENVAWVIIGGTSPIPGAVGMAPINVWHFGTTYRPFGVAFSANVYPDGLSLTDVAEAAAHEPGHLFGLFHSTDPTDIMWPYVDGTMHTFNAENRAALDSIVGVYAPEEIVPDVPSPQLAWLAPVLLLMRRHNRHNQPRPASAGTSLISTTFTGARARQFSLRAAASRFGALTYTVWAYCCSATSCSKMASTLYRGINRA